MEPYEFPNVEAELRAVIVSQVRVPASVQVPNPRPTEFVQVTRVGGVADKTTDHPMVTFFVWAASWEAAAELASLVRRRVTGITRMGALPVYRVREIGGPSRAPDPTDGSPRYQFTIEYKIRGSQAT